MKMFILALTSVLTIGSIAGADEYVNGYYKQDGSYVQPHYRTSPDSSTANNYSTQGNTNPYTGQAGTVNPNNYTNQGSHTKHKGY